MKKILFFLTILSSSSIVSGPCLSKRFEIPDELTVAQAKNLSYTNELVGLDIRYRAYRGVPIMVLKIDYEDHFYIHNKDKGAGAYQYAGTEENAHFIATHLALIRAGQET